MEISQLAKRLVGSVVKRITSNDKITGSIPVRGRCGQPPAVSFFFLFFPLSFFALFSCPSCLLPANFKYTMSKEPTESVHGEARTECQDLHDSDSTFRKEKCSFRLR